MLRFIIYWSLSPSTLPSRIKKKQNLAHAGLPQAILVTVEWKAAGPNELIVISKGWRMNFVCKEPTAVLACRQRQSNGLEAECPAEHSAARPTIILEAGLPFTSVAWSNVLSDQYAGQQLSQYRVCAYDRPGYGWSSRVSGQRDGYTHW